MNRAAVVAALTLLIIWQSQCLTIHEWTLSNRCGLWQWGTGGDLIIALRMPTSPSVQPKPRPTVVILDDSAPAIVHGLPKEIRPARYIGGGMTTAITVSPMQYMTTSPTFSSSSGTLTYPLR